MKIPASGMTALQQADMTEVEAALERAYSALPQDLPHEVPHKVHLEYRKFVLDLVKMQDRALKLHQKLKKHTPR